MSDEQRRWESFAQRDAEYFVYTPRVGKTATADAYFDHGRMLANRITAEVKSHLSKWERAVEIGCGTGRVAIPMAELFDRLVGVDVAPTMLEKLRANCIARAVTNVAGVLPDTPWDAEPADLVYSVQVFQHIESVALIDDYLRRVAKCLTGHDGVGYLHFDTRPQSLPYHARRVLPDAVLPRAWRRGIRRTRRDPAWIEARLYGYGLTVIDRLRPSTAGHVFIVAKR